MKFSHSLRGVVLLLLSAAFFALATVAVKLTTDHSAVSGRTIAFARFLFGFAAVAVWAFAAKTPLTPRRWRYIALRSVFNATAVALFFSGISHTTVTHANMLNMTYPVFVFLVAPLLNREKSPRMYYLFLVITMAGVWMVISPTGGMNLQELNRGDLLAFGSGISASLAISSLREARKFDSSLAILFYMMGFGTLVTGLIMIPGFVLPAGDIWLYVLGAGLFSLGGQICLTVGYRYISAAGGALVSSSRIVIAVLLGSIIFADPLGLNTVIGGIFILISLLGVSGVIQRFVGKLR